MTKLEAVNDMLEAVGEPPVDAIDPSDGLSSDAERTLDSEDKRIQSRGWAVNTDFATDLSPDGSDNISLPADALRFELAGDSRGRRIVSRGGTLYDQDDNTDEFDDDVTVDVVKQIDFPDLPETLAAYIASAAAIRFARAKLGPDNVDAVLVQAMQQAQAIANTEDTDLRHVNVLDTAEMSRIKGNRPRHHWSN